MTNIFAIVLAGGKGTRMKSLTLPKVLFPVAGRPMIAYVLEAIADAGIRKPIIVVGFLGKKVIEALGDSYTYVTQRYRLGTGHAALQAMPLLTGKPGCTLITVGDQPFIRPASFKRLLSAVMNDGATVAVMVGAREGSTAFDAFGRVITDAQGHVLRIVEVKDATEEEKAVRAVNLSVYAVDNVWLWKALKRVKKSPVTSEYYLTDIVAEAVKEQRKVVAVEIEDTAEAMGINSLAHLTEAEKLYLSQGK